MKLDMSVMAPEPNSIMYLVSSAYQPARLYGYIYIYIYIYRVSQEECARLREGVPYVKVYRYNQKHLCPKLYGCGDRAREM
jgi:hypothetical protein